MTCWILEVFVFTSCNNSDISSYTSALRFNMPVEYMWITAGLSHKAYHQNLTCILDFAFPVVPKEPDDTRH